MSRSTSASDKRFRFACWCCITVIAAFPVASGCTNLDLYSDSSLEQRDSQLFGPQHSADSERDFFGVSNKAREIERNCMR